MQEPHALADRLAINLTSVLLFSRLALAYMKPAAGGGAPADEGAAKSITLVSSIAGITEAPGLFGYTSAKHGVIGLMRALRRYAPPRYGGVRANAGCPWATDTDMMAGTDVWTGAGLPLNSPADVGRVMLGLAADPDRNGAAAFVSGGRAFDTEAGIAETLPVWMGRENAAEWLRGQELLGLVSTYYLLPLLHTLALVDAPWSACEFRKER